MAKKTSGRKKPAEGSALKKLIPVLIILLAAGAIFGVRFIKPPKPPVEFHEGIGYATWSKSAYLLPESDESIAELASLGGNWMSVLVTWYQSTCWSGDIHMGEETPSDEAVIHAIREAHKKGLKVMLKPHLDIIDTSDGSWRGEIGCLKDPDWEKWFREYTEFLLHYIKIANQEKVEMFCVGTELSTSATVKGYMWSDMIKKLRGRYFGLMTYAAHWDRYMDIRFWDQLDFIGINAYFPLSKKMKPTYSELMEGWVPWVEEMEAFQKSIGKPVIFPEAGCTSADGAAIRPWEHVARGEVNIKLQADYYQAIVDTFWQKEWFYGLYWWYWGTNVHMGGKYNRGFTPQNKPALDIIKEWYSKPLPR